MARYKGYAFMVKNGEYFPPVTLRNEREVVSWASLHKRFFPEIRVVDEMDYIVLHALDGKIVFPVDEGE